MLSLIIIIVIYLVVCLFATAMFFSEDVGGMLFVLCIVGTIPMAIISADWVTYEGEWQHDRKVLLGLDDGKQQFAEGESSFFVSTYREGEEFKYTFYAADEDGRTQLYNANTKHYTIVQDVKPDEQPYVLNDFVCVRDSSIWTFTSCEGSESNMDELHVRPNTIRQDFLLDAK